MLERESETLARASELSLLKSQREALLSELAKLPRSSSAREELEMRLGECEAKIDLGSG